MRATQQPRREGPDEARTLACSLDRLYPEHWAGPNQPGCKGWLTASAGTPARHCTCQCHADGKRTAQPPPPVPLKRR
ncbi:hypothetical protein J2S41_004520 [Catenuloplanes atrovinosus]|uniref:Uncharacterized protein n=1 Tax=Catenuloplanes atrovinosus TaxID=137266 RepID=A0AAE3YSC6_9ACTN|nr:hypothetical protein [Catenuloplanes atrovinosus]